MMFVIFAVHLMGASSMMGWSCPRRPVCTVSARRGAHTSSSPAQERDPTSSIAVGGRSQKHEVIHARAETVG